MANVALLTVHGMGETQPHYHESLVQALRRKLGKQRFDANVSVHPVYYQHLLQANEEKVWASCADLVHYDELRRFLLFGFADAAGLETNKDSANSVYEGAQREIMTRLLEARTSVGDGGPVVAIAQSLGGQVFSSYLYDAQKARAALAGAALPYPSAGLWQQASVAQMDAARRGFGSGQQLRTLITTGCNIPIFVAAHQHMSIKPIAKTHADFRWINLYDPDDVLGWPLQPLSPSYQALVEDRRINSGTGAWDWLVKSWNPMSHTAYWTDGDVVKGVSQALEPFL